MIFTDQIAKKLGVLVDPEVEKAILLLLDTALNQKEAVTEDPNASDAQLRQFQGQKMLIKELKEYKKRLNDAIKRGKDGAELPTGP